MVGPLPAQRLRSATKPSFTLPAHTAPAHTAMIVCALMLATCGETFQAEYNIRLLVVPGQDPLRDAITVSLEAQGTGLQTTVPVKAGKAPALSLTKLDPRKVAATTFVVKVNGPQGLLAYGQSPRIRLLRSNGDILITVQAPGTLAPAPVDPVGPPFPRLADVNVVTAVAAETTDPRPVAVPVLLGGRTLGANDVEQATSLTSVYNPYFSGIVNLQLSTPTVVGAAVWPRGDGSIWFFGGRPGTMIEDSGAAYQLRTFQSVTTLGLGLVATYGSDTVTTPINRAFSVMAEKDNVLYAFGGEATDPTTKVPAALASVVQILPSAGTAQVVTLSNLVMLTPRVGHTVNAVSVAAVPTHFLIFGGSVAAGPVAELMTDAGPVELGIDAGPLRSGHTVVGRPDGRLLILGGVGVDGLPLADARIYDPTDRSFAAAPLAIQTPRANAAIFAVGNDLVICGGTDAAGTLVATAERFELTTLAPLPTLAAIPRTGAKVAYLPDGTALLVGGRANDAKGLRPTSTLELYRPQLIPTIP